MQTVYAYDDQGCFAPWSRWKPHSVLCTNSADFSDTPGTNPYHADIEKVFRAGVTAEGVMAEEVMGGRLRLGMPSFCRAARAGSSAGTGGEQQMGAAVEGAALAAGVGR